MYLQFTFPGQIETDVQGCLGIVLSSGECLLLNY